MKDNREYGKRLIVAVCQNYGVKINLLDRQLKKIIGEGYLATNIARKRNVPMHILEKAIKLLSTYPAHIIELDNLERELNAYDKKKKAVKGKDIKRLKKARKIYAAALKQLKKSVGITGGIVGIDIDSYENLKQLKENRYDDDYILGSYGFDDDDDDFFDGGYSGFESPNELSYEALMGNAERRQRFYDEPIQEEARMQSTNQYDPGVQSRVDEQILYLSTMMKTLTQQQNGILEVIAQMTGNAPVTNQPQTAVNYVTSEDGYSMTIDPIAEEPQLYTSGNLTPGEEIDYDVEEENSNTNTEDEAVEKKEDYTDPMFYNLPK